MFSLTPLAATVEIAQLGARRRATAQFQGMVTFAVVSGLASATLVMVAALTRVI